MSILLSVNCPPGTYSDSHGNTCVECNPGFYQDQEGMTECQPCPKSYSHIITGSKSSDDCKRKMSIVGFDNSWNSVIWNLTVAVSCQTNLISTPHVELYWAAMLPRNITCHNKCKLKFRLQTNIWKPTVRPKLSLIFKVPVEWQSNLFGDCSLHSQAFIFFNFFVFNPCNFW